MSGSVNKGSELQDDKATQSAPSQESRNKEPKKESKNDSQLTDTQAPHEKSEKWYGFYLKFFSGEIKNSVDLWRALPEVREEDVDPARSCFQAIANNPDLLDKCKRWRVFETMPDYNSVADQAKEKTESKLGALKTFSNLFTKKAESTNTIKTEPKLSTIQISDNLLTKYATDLKTPSVFIKFLTSIFPTLAVDAVIQLEEWRKYYSQKRISADPAINGTVNTERLEHYTTAKICLIFHLDKAVFTPRTLNQYEEQELLYKYCITHIPDFKPTEENVRNETSISNPLFIHWGRETYTTLKTVIENSNDIRSIADTEKDIRQCHIVTFDFPETREKLTKSFELDSRILTGPTVFEGGKTWVYISKDNLGRTYKNCSPFLAGLLERLHFRKTLINARALSSSSKTKKTEQKQPTPISKPEDTPLKTADRPSMADTMRDIEHKIEGTEEDFLETEKMAIHGQALIELNVVNKLIHLCNSNNITDIPNIKNMKGYNEKAKTMLFDQQDYQNLMFMHHALRQRRFPRPEQLTQQISSSSITPIAIYPSLNSASHTSSLPTTNEPTRV